MIKKHNFGITLTGWYQYLDDVLVPRWVFKETDNPDELFIRYFACSASMLDIMLTFFKWYKPNTVTTAVNVPFSWCSSEIWSSKFFPF